MVEQQSVDSHEPTRMGVRAAAEKASSVEQGSKSRKDFFSRASTTGEHQPGLKRRPVIGALGVLVLALALIFGVPGDGYVRYSTGSGKVVRHIARHGESPVSKAKVRDSAL